MSYETFYEAFCLEPKGRLEDLGLSLPAGREGRRKRTRPREDKDSDRPIEVSQRVIPGHWEGDLILGARNWSAVITLVLEALKNTVQLLDKSVWSSITWDQGSEMVGYKAFSMVTDIPVYFAHPGYPWERGSNENTRGRPRRKHSGPAWALKAHQTVKPSWGCFGVC